MNNNKLTSVLLKPNQALGLSAISILALSNLISIHPVTAAEKTDASQLHPELTTELAVKPTEDLTQESQTTSFQLSQHLTSSPTPETISQVETSSNLVQSLKQPEKIAQTDPGVGDSFDETNRIREQLLIEPIVETGTTRIIAAPSSSAGTPTAYGASWRQAFIGGGLYFPFDGDVDGSLSVGFGLGDAVKAAGLEVSVNILSVGGQEPNFGDFAESGTVGLKLHRYLSANTAVAVGWSNAIKWGEADNNVETIYGVVTQRLDKLTVSLGLGSGSYRSKGARAAQENDPNFFGSIGYRFIPQASLVSSWTGRSLNVGASFAPFQNAPIVINTIFTDVTDNINDAGFSLTAGYSINF